MADKIDRRIRKTKSLLRKSLAKLMQFKSIKEITIKELVDEADINRSTFYLHYTDIYHMLESIESEMLNEILNVINSHSIGNLNEDTFPFIADIFSILSDNKEICCALLGPNGDINFVHKIESIIAENSLASIAPMFPSSIDDLKYSYAFCLSGCVGLIKAWLTGENNCSQEHMAVLTYRLVINTLKDYHS